VADKIMMGWRKMGLKKIETKYDVKNDKGKSRMA